MELSSNRFGGRCSETNGECGAERPLSAWGFQLVTLNSSAYGYCAGHASGICIEMTFCCSTLHRKSMKLSPLANMSTSPVPTSSSNGSGARLAMLPPIPRGPPPIAPMLEAK